MGFFKKVFKNGGNNESPINVKSNEDEVEKIEDEDGYRELEFRDGGVFLSIYPALGNGKEIDEEDITQELDDLGVHYNEDAILGAKIQKSKNILVSTRSFKPPVNFFRVSFNKHETECFLTVYSSSNRYLNVSNIEDYMREQDILFDDIDPLIIEEIVAKKDGMPHSVLKTENVIDGVSGYIEIYKTSSKNALKYIKEHEKLEIILSEVFDTENLKLVEENEEVGQVHLKKDGIGGINVKGQFIEPDKAEDVKVFHNSTIKIIDNKIVALKNGYLEVNGNKVLVRDVEVIRKNEIKREIINTDKHLIIYGDITDGTQITSKGNVEIIGTVYNSTIKSEANVKIMGGIIGSGCHIQADETVFAKYAEGSKIIGRTVIIQSSVLGCSIHSTEDICVLGKGIISGMAQAGKDVYCTYIGKQKSTTNVTVKAGMNFYLQEQLDAIDAEMKELFTLIKESEDRIQDLEYLKEDDSTGKYEREYNQVRETLIEMKTIINDIQEKRKEKYGEFDKSKNIVFVSKMAWEGSEVCIGKTSNVLKYDKGPKKFSLKTRL